MLNVTMSPEEKRHHCLERKMAKRALSVRVTELAIEMSMRRIIYPTLSS